jgi:hypothetical protein
LRRSIKESDANKENEENSQGKQPGPCRGTRREVYLDEAVHDLCGRGLEGEVIDVTCLRVKPAPHDAVYNDLGRHIDEEECVWPDANLLNRFRL